MISPMNIPITENNICIEYLGNEYISFPCGSIVGTNFYILSMNVTTDVSNIDYGQFTTNMVAVVDPTQYIVDDAFNAYYKVTQYTSTQTTRPPRI